MITVMQEQLLQEIHFWVTNRQRLGLPVEAEEFTTATASGQTALMTRMHEDEAKVDKDQVATVPEKFTESFEEGLDTYPSLLKGTGRIPLNYVIHCNVIADPTAIYESD
jgi:hypothetical protein